MDSLKTGYWVAGADFRIGDLRGEDEPIGAVDGRSSAPLQINCERWM
jgi:hypothetical protein